MNEAQIEEYIKRVGLFNGLHTEEVAKILHKGMVMGCRQGDVLFRKGDPGDRMYVVLGGKIGVFEGQQCIASLYVGDMFGEMGLVNKAPRSATVIALEDSKVFVLTEEFFERLMTKKVAIRMLMNVVRTLSNRVKQLNARLSSE